MLNVQFILEVESAVCREDTDGRLCEPQTESRRTLVIRALADAVLEGDESFTVQLLAAKSDAVIDPVDGQCLWLPHCV